MAEVNCIRIPREVAESASKRFLGIEAAIRNAAAALDGGTQETQLSVPNALEFVADEISRLYSDLDGSTWHRSENQVRS